VVGAAAQVGLEDLEDPGVVDAAAVPDSEDRAVDAAVAAAVVADPHRLMAAGSSATA